MDRAQYKAAYYETIGKAEEVIKIGYFDLFPLKDNEVRVKLITSGVNPSDIKIRKGERGKILFPKIIPHNDGAGIVIALGSMVKNLKIVDRVWLYNASWQKFDGTAAEICTLDEKYVIPLPANIDFETAACLGVPALTAASCLLSLGINKPSDIIITGGAGSVGLFAIQLAKFLGHRVITTISSEERKEIA